VKITPSLPAFSLKVVATETLSKIASTTTLESRFCSDAQLSKGFQNRINFVRLFNFAFAAWEQVIDDVLVINLGMLIY